MARPATTSVRPIVYPVAEPLLQFVFATDESLPSSGLIDGALAIRIADLRSKGCGLAAGDWKIEGPRRHTCAWPVDQAG